MHCVAQLRRCALWLVLVMAAQLYADYLRYAALLHGDTVDHVGGLHHALAVRHQQELRLLTERVQQVCETAYVAFVEGRIDFVERAERARPDLEDANQ